MRSATRSWHHLRSASVIAFDLKIVPKVNNRLAEQRLTIHAFSVRGTVTRAPTHGQIGMSVHLDTAKARMIHVNDNLPDKIFSGYLGTLGRGD